MEGISEMQGSDNDCQNTSYSQQQRVELWRT